MVAAVAGTWLCTSTGAVADGAGLDRADVEDDVDLLLGVCAGSRTLRTSCGERELCLLI
jgi:hypothetical protein